MSKSRVTGGWLSQPVISCPPGVNARIPRLLQWPGKERVQEVIAWLWGSVGDGNALEQYSWALSVLIRTLLPDGMAYGRGNPEASCLLLHVLVACQAFRRRKPQRWACPVARVLSVGGFVSFKIWTHHLLYSCVVYVRVWVLQKVGLCMVSSPRKRCMLARHLLVVHTLQVWLHVSQNTSPKKRWRTRSHCKPVQFPGALWVDIPFSPLYTAQIREEHAYYGFQGPLYLFEPCRLGLFLAYCAKGSNRSNFPWIRVPRSPR